jgi:hypothetical protein
MASQWVGQWQGRWDGRLIGPIDPSFLTGTGSLYLSATGTAYGAGVIVGDSLFALSAAGDIENGSFAVDASGTATIQFGASATLIGALLASGAAEIVLSASGDAYLATNAAGSADLLLGASGAATAIGAVLGGGQVTLDGAAALHGVGTLSGSSSVAILPSGDIFSPLWASGASDIILGVSGGINGALWADGQADVEIGSTGMLTAIGRMSGQAWVALNGRHFDLTKYQRLYVRHVLQTTYNAEAVERIVAVAERHNLSAVDAVSVVRAQAGEQTIVVLPRKKVSIEKPLRQVNEPAPKKAKETMAAYSVARNEAVYASAGQFHVFANHSTESVVSGHVQEILSITNKPSRAAHTPT